MEVMWPYIGAERPNFNVNWDKRVNAMQTYVKVLSTLLRMVVTYLYWSKAYVINKSKMVAIFTFGFHENFPTAADHIM